MSNRAQNRTRGAKATRKRSAAILRAETNVTAFARTPDAHTLAQNPNTAKRHAARLAPGHDGSRRKTDPRIELRTSFARIPSLGTIRTKNLPTWRS